MININLLPKNLRRRSEPGYWRLIALFFPLLVLGVAGFMQVAINGTARSLAEERDLRELKLTTLQPAIQEQELLQARQRQLSELIAVRNAVQAGRIDWTDEVASMLETLPPRTETGQPRIEFNALSMRALGGEPNDAYDGLSTIAEMTVAGTAINSEVLASYVRSLELSPLFAVAFQNAARDEESGFYDFSLTIGALAGEQPEQPELESSASLDADLGDTP